MTLMPLIPVIVMCDAATEVQTINSSITKLCDSGTFHNVKANQSRVEGWHVQQLYDCILIIRNRDINTNTVTTMLRIFPVHLSIRSLLLFFLDEFDDITHRRLCLQQPDLGGYYCIDDSMIIIIIIIIVQ